MTLTSCPFCHHDYYNPSSTPTPVPPEATYLLHGDLLTLQALGVTHDLPHPSCTPIPDDPRMALPSAHYFALMRALCISNHRLHTDSREETTRGTHGGTRQQCVRAQVNAPFPFSQKRGMISHGLCSPYPRTSLLATIPVAHTHTFVPYDIPRFVSWLPG